MKRNKTKRIHLNGVENISNKKKFLWQKNLHIRVRLDSRLAVLTLPDELLKAQIINVPTYNRAKQKILRDMKSNPKEPVFLTKNGRGRYVVIDIDEYERERAEKKLLMKLHEAEEAVKDGEGWLNLEELKAAMGD